MKRTQAEQVVGFVWVAAWVGLGSGCVVAEVAVASVERSAAEQAVCLISLGSDVSACLLGRSCSCAQVRSLSHLQGNQRLLSRLT